MSKKRKSRTVPSQCLVIDASIAGAAGSAESVHPTGIACRDFLLTVRKVCHRMAWTSAIKAEWDRHQTKFAMTWLVSMQSLRKLRMDIDEAEISEIRDAVREKSDEFVATIVLKDCHLIEAALHCDRIIASLDDVARGHFQRLGIAKKVAWVNPGNEAEGPTSWLESGAPRDRNRLLK